VPVKMSARSGVLATVAVGVGLVFSGTAYADLKDDKRETSGESDADGNIGAGVSVEPKITYTPAASSPEGALTSGSSWSPPGCYYAPTHSPDEYEAYWNALSSRIHTPPWPAEDVQAFRRSREEMVGEDGEFPDYNKDKQGEGMFWMRVINEDRPREEWFTCEFRTFWVDFTDPPPDQPLVVSSDVLAELAWEQTRVPDTVISLSPEAASQKVNLATWIWLDSADFQPVTVRAELEQYGIWAETTATPTSLTIEAGTEDAVLHPASGVCEVKDGAIGEPYARGRAGEVPPCGVTYGRATHGVGSHPLRATLTWQVEWRDHQGNGGSLADGSVSETVDVVVEEVQAIVR
jgi:enoyl reductase